MNILVISDTHGSCYIAFKIYHKLMKEQGLDLIVHCGDYFRDAIELGSKVSTPIIWIKGNCDGSYSDEDFKIVETEFGNILVTHGHMENVEYSMQNLYYKTLDNNCICAFFGHTHRAVNTEANGIRLINPGSLTKPRDNLGGSFALVTTSTADLSCKIYSIKDYLAGNASSHPVSKKITGGKLRDIFNYSDRF